MYYVYILHCANDSFYTGCANDLKQRLYRHQNGQVISTKKLLPVKLIFYSCFSNKYLAYNFEKYLKSGSGRAFMNKHLINKK